MSEPNWLDSPASGPVDHVASHRHRIPDLDADDWLSHAWISLPERDREVLVRRTAGETLDDIGADLGVSRERVRQLQKKADQLITLAATAHDEDLLHRLALLVGDSPATASDELAGELPPATADAQRTLLRISRILHPRTWDGELTEWWTRKPDDLNRRLNVVAELAPLSHNDLHAALEQVGLGYRPPVSTLLASANSRLTRHALGWYRPARVGRDLAFLYLQDEGTPRTVAEIATVTGVGEHAIRETMRREDAFAQVRPEGTWALTDWRTPGADNRYSNAVEAVIDVVRECGPLPLSELRREVLARYPVSAWRINQCLSSAMIGLTADGRYDLAERGAIPIEDTEPKRPATIFAKGDVVGVNLKVNHDLLRGSGIPVNRWLTWHLGLRLVPSARSFSLEPQGDEITIKRASSNAQISSLRVAVQALDLVEGCSIALVLNVRNHTAKIHHLCPSDTCPAT
ncbi:sigma factor-like helix-turn-helix DNA-binding protein [Williamsia muralis]|uniref:Sigma factor-like helix-turn-helix DNA-binding protein n=1 Tax=Williamsia marianensis TaxID=85044 RepID=A0ABU4EV58_WILMA|nr:sigma factor-like helix-turn-helix DNA-binding protein [Williamsia muralis]MDV7134519.1 sigma factor-like helix-turn-helix DNA-binding protein [Williamsia muralis]